MGRAHILQDNERIVQGYMAMARWGTSKTERGDAGVASAALRCAASTPGGAPSKSERRHQGTTEGD
ncbi:MAG: hypothetical protein KatS3mg111_2148 [Pirellulaceae bacterium]|nr:MAG: hypothetical protein KatS3mg111_2148 [Pirellulaceae bacterium]